MAGGSLTGKKGMAIPVRPGDPDQALQPITEEFGGMVVGDGKVEETKGEEQNQAWQVVLEKVHGLTKEVAEYIDDGNARATRLPPMMKAPQQPTREEHERHQTTHTPYAAWGKHCATARVVRAQR